MQTITIIAVTNGVAAIGFAALWWRGRSIVEAAELKRDQAETARDITEAKARERLKENSSLNAKIDGLELQAKEDAKNLSRLRESGRRAAEKIAELEPLAEQARRAQAQRVAASQAAAAKRSKAAVQ
jgi:hypothetical protein